MFRGISTAPRADGRLFSVANSGVSRLDKPFGRKYFGRKGECADFCNSCKDGHLDNSSELPLNAGWLGLSQRVRVAFATTLPSPPGLLLWLLRWEHFNVDNAEH